MSDWLIFRGTGDPHDAVDDLQDPPPWRQFDGEPGGPDAAPIEPYSLRKLGVSQGHTRNDHLGDDALGRINAALYLRRPLLVTGEPGAGKSTLAHSLAYELNLGRVLRWPIVSSSTLRDGLYQYDALGRLQDLQMAQMADRDDGTVRRENRTDHGIGKYLRLGPLGTALLPSERPRVLLIDELDKSDIDLPNNLLNVLEEGQFTVPELERIADQVPEVDLLCDDGSPVTVRQGKVLCHAFPVIVITSNQEREFPLPLLRRCIPLELETPTGERLAAMVKAHFGEDADSRFEELIRHFERSREHGGVHTVDQLMNAIRITEQARVLQAEGEPVSRIAKELMAPLGRRG
ncbi:MoxR family ATPase [Streptomyces sp. NPDC051940]|uniref:AAA family ATPase n=1 Tax=Streptomyces sp. NPDC051940 TaxID=3155675 RepID=UPI00344A88BE